MFSQINRQPGIANNAKTLNTTVLLGVLMLCSLILDVLFFSYTLEDAQITYRYVLRFTEGYEFGMWNRTGAPVEGFTTFLWMVILSLFGPGLESIISASKVLGIVAHQSIIWLFVTLYSRYSCHEKANGGKLAVNLFKGNESAAANAFLYSAVAVAIFMPLCWYASTGMETLLFIALVSAVFFLPLLTTNVIVLSAVTILLVLTRPDGLLFAFASPLYFFLITLYKSNDKSQRNTFVVLMAVALLTFAALAAFRYGHFGHLMPNTYYAKSANVTGLGHIKYGILYFGSYVVNYIYLFIPVFVASLLIIRKQTFADNSFLPMAFAGIVLYFLIVAKAGGDNFSAFPMWRHGINLLPLTVFCTFFSLFQMKLKQANNLAKAFVVLMFVMPVTFSVPTSNANFLRTDLLAKAQRFPDFSHDYNNNKMLLWLKNITNEDTVVTTALAGELPLTVDATHIDVLGLNNQYIAHNGTFDVNGPIDSKSDMAWVMSQKPDIVEGYMDADKIIHQQDLHTAISKRGKMNLEMIRAKEFPNYLIITNAPYQALNRVLFISKDYYQNIREQHDVQVMDVEFLIKAAAQHD